MFPDVPVIDRPGIISAWDGSLVGENGSPSGLQGATRLLRSVSRACGPALTQRRQR